MLLKWQFILKLTRVPWNEFLEVASDVALKRLSQLPQFDEEALMHS